jgi:ABC-type uncharacterized transport system substrate-binding protein
VFEIGNDPIQLGLVDSLNRPGGNVTGANQMNIEVAPKRLELLHEVLPSEHIIALLVDPADPNSTNTTIRDVRAAARNLGLEVRVLNASCEADFEPPLPSCANCEQADLSSAAARSSSLKVNIWPRCLSIMPFQQFMSTESSLLPAA